MFVVEYTSNKEIDSKWFSSWGSAWFFAKSLSGAVKISGYRHGFKLGRKKIGARYMLLWARMA